MKYFLIILLGLISFLSPAQEVVIPANVARYFLEQDDRVKLLVKKDSANKQIVSDLQFETQVQKSFISSYRSDFATYKSKLLIKEQEISIVKQDLIIERKISNKKDFKVSLFEGAAIGAGTGSFIPAIGTVAGGIVGAAVGSVVYIVKKIKKTI